MYLGTPNGRRGGFTLVEILIVVIILGILAAVVMPRFSSASEDLRYSSLRAQLKTVRSAIAVYQLQHMDNLPDLSKGWTPLLTQTNPEGGSTGNKLTGPYLKTPPVNPITGGAVISTTSAAGVDWVWTAGTRKLTALDTHGNPVSDAP
jgi:general secretion pathway protein G